MLCSGCSSKIEDVNVEHCPKCGQIGFWFYCPARCDVCGYVFQNLIVHHLDGNHQNNLVANKIKICKVCHAQIHHGKNTHPNGRPSKEDLIRREDPAAEYLLERYRNILLGIEYKKEEDKLRLERERILKDYQENDKEILDKLETNKEKGISL